MAEISGLSESVRVYDGVNTTVHDGVNTSEKTKYARIPAFVGLDRNLSDRDVRVYFALALYERNGSTRAGFRWMSKACGVPYTKIGFSIKRLVACGHVEVEGAGKGMRQIYRLTSPVFARQTKGRGVTGNSAPVEIHNCAKCGVPSANVDKACYCRPCSRMARKIAAVDVKVDQKMERLVSQPRKRTA